MSPFTTDPNPQRTAELAEAERIATELVAALWAWASLLYHFPAREKRAKQANSTCNSA